MSNFKIIKCKKCDASLVEMQDEKIDRCIQCGYIFNLVKDAKVANKRQITTHSKTLKTTPEVSQLVRKLRNIKDQKTADVPAKKKFGLIKVIKWYFIIAFVLAFLSSIFSLWEIKIVE
ncbi:MAG: hypothetical protein JKY19_02185 [Alcanivoracaceae bacterium]|nr:hypothetical protein [Alcanivoracaceae bacterium]